MGKRAESLEGTLTMTEATELTEAMNRARQLIYLKNMAAVSRSLLTKFGQKDFADGFFGRTADWFDERAKAGDYDPIIKGLEPYAGRLPAIDSILEDLYVAFPVLKEQPARPV